MMAAADIEVALERAERALGEGRGLQGTGFWRAVAVLRGDRPLAERYADRVGAIDRAAFESGVRLRVPLAVGLVALVLVSGVGMLAIVAASRAADPVLWVRINGGPILYQRRGFVPIAFLFGLAALLIGTHSLAHWIVGRALGIRFTHVFLGGPPPPRPGLKTDYATYLRVSPRNRAAMHASGAVFTKIVPFALLFVPLGSFYWQWWWLRWILLAVGASQIVTDVVLSTKVSDWKKARREWRAAKS